MTRLYGLAGACHPLPSIAVTTIAGVFAAAAGRGVGGTVLVAATILASQLSVGWANDYLDRDRDRAAGRTDKPIVAGRVSAESVRVAAMVAGVALIGLATVHGWPAAAAGLAAFGAALAYDAGIKGTALSPLPYAISFGLLPAFVTLGGVDVRWPPAWITAAATLLGVGAHFANVLPDIEGDRTTGVRGLPQRLGRSRSALIAAVTLAAAAIVLAFGPGDPSALRAAMAAVALVGGVAVAAIGRSGGRPQARLAFLAVVAVALIAVALLMMSGEAIAGSGDRLGEIRSAATIEDRYAKPP